jgi:hypothetical protein
MNTRPGRATTLLASGLYEHLIGGTMGGTPSAAPETGTSETLIGRSGLDERDRPDPWGERLAPVGNLPSRAPSFPLDHQRTF